MRRALAIAMLLAIIFSGCGRKKRARIPAVPPPVPAVGTVEEGVASWYGHPYHGRPAADGEIYDMEQLTAAHRTLPFGTWVRVQNIQNQKYVDVRINDRGPFVDGRIIDLSHAAAREIAMIGPGTARVRMEIISVPAATGPSLFGVQVGAFQNKTNADNLRREMAAKYGSARLVMRPGDPATWRVLVGAEPTQGGASSLRDRIRTENHEHAAAFVVRLDS